jgi:hypothetical protein
MAYNYYYICGMPNPVAWRDNHAIFCNKYLMLLTEYTDEQAGRVCGNWGGAVGPEKVRISNAVCAVIGQVMTLKRATCLRLGEAHVTVG